MLKHEEISITEEYGNGVAPYQYRITHIPSGIYVIGNTGSEAGKPRLQEHLLTALERSISDWTPPKPKSQAEEIAELQARLEQLQGKPKVSKATVEIAKKRGRPKGAKMVDGKLVKPATAPEGYSVLDPSKVQAPPTVQVFENRVYKPSKTVAVSNVTDIQP